MNQHREDAPLEVAFEGWLAGAGGALALTGMVALGRKVMAGTNAPVPVQADAGISAATALARRSPAGAGAWHPPSSIWPTVLSHASRPRRLRLELLGRGLHGDAPAGDLADRRPEPLRRAGLD